jgi:penicillin-binding protein 2
MPGEEWWKQQNKGPWTTAKTANVSIGQGEVQTTPLEMALVSGAVASNGKVYQPTLVHHHVKYSRGRNGEPVQLRSEFKSKLKFDLLNLGENSAKAKDLAMIRDGMWKVVNDKSGGTGKAAQLDYGVAGKTGTAQKWRIDKATGKKIADNHTWFVAFAPYDNPKVAVCVVIANGNSGGGTAAPVAKRVIQRTLGLEDGRYQQAIAPLAPATGHFNFIETVSYPGEDQLVLEPGEDPGVPVDTGSEEPLVVKPVPNPTPDKPRVEEDTSAGTPEPSIRKQNFRKQPGPD